MGRLQVRLAGLALLLAAFASSGSAIAEELSVTSGLVNPPEATVSGQYKPFYTVVPYKGSRGLAGSQTQPAAAVTIPNWTRTISSGGKSYTFFMVGKDVATKQTNATVLIKTPIVPIVFTFKNAQGQVIGKSDPRAADATCSPHGTPLNQVLNSPMFKPLSNLKVGAVSLGKGQFVSLFQRANFYAFTNPGGLNPGYQVNLSPITAIAIAIPVSNETPEMKPCGVLWTVDLAQFDNLVQTQIFPLIARQGIGPTTFPIFLLYNVGLVSGGKCCALGYHGAFDNPNFGNNFQSYGVVDYDTNDPSLDTIPLSHEIAEWMDDPTGVNPTPSWGHLGQVPGCQNNLEVGDPLTGAFTKTILMNGFNYHVQDLVFFSWFYHQKPSIGANGWYSLFGVFKTPSKPCT